MTSRITGPLIRVARTPEADPTLPLPGYATVEAAGADIRADLPEAVRAQGLTLAPGARHLIPTGLIFEIPAGWEVQARPRSGLALKRGLTLINSPGTIDSDYRGEIGIPMVNLSDDPQTIAHGERIAQLVVAPAPQAQFDATDRVGDTQRGAGGFGSTGTA